MLPVSHLVGATPAETKEMRVLFSSSALIAPHRMSALMEDSEDGKDPGMYEHDNLASPRHVSSHSEPPRRSARIQLGDDLWFDQERYAILRQGWDLPLTAREMDLLTRLLKAPRRFLSATLLARQLSKPGEYPLDEHCIEQTMYGLRRKLGEPIGHPALLLNRRGLGYGLFLQDTFVQALKDERNSVAQGEHEEET